MKDIEPCRRPSGNFRAHFSTREEAEAFAKDAKNVDYHGDIAVFCCHCGWFHLSQESWLPSRPWETPASQLRRN
jgi:hypothetical protein